MVDRSVEALKQEELLDLKAQSNRTSERLLEVIELLYFMQFNITFLIIF